MSGLRKTKNGWIMKQYIDKAKVVAEIERLKECNHKICGGDFDFLKKAYPKHYYSTEIYNDILSFLDTLEVKDVDLDKEIEKWIDDDAITHEDCSITDVISTAKHFFELGLKAKKGSKL